MKIHMNMPPVPPTTVGRQVSSPAGNGDIALSGVSEDRVTLGSSTGNVQSLTAQAMSTPAIRQDKVAALQAAVNGGSYQIDPGQIASAMLADGQH